MDPYRTPVNSPRGFKERVFSEKREKATIRVLSDDDFNKFMIDFMVVENPNSYINTELLELIRELKGQCEDDEDIYYIYNSNVAQLYNRFMTHVYRSFYTLLNPNGLLPQPSIFIQHSQFQSWDIHLLGLRNLIILQLLPEEDDYQEAINGITVNNQNFREFLETRLLPIPRQF